MTSKVSIPADLVSFGNLIDAQGGHPVGPTGLAVTQTSLALDDPFLRHCIPQPLIGLVDTLEDRIEAQARYGGALIVYPIIEQAGSRAVVSRVVACRIGLHKCTTSRGLRRVAVINAVLLQPSDFAETTARLVPLLGEHLDLAPVTNRLPPAARLSMPRRALELGTSPGRERTTVTKAEAERVGALLAALENGTGARFGSETFKTEAAFLKSMGSALALLPAGERCMVSFATGYRRHSAGLHVLHSTAVGLKRPVSTKQHRRNGVVEPTIPAASRYTSLASAPVDDLALGDVGGREAEVRPLAERILAADWLQPDEVLLVLASPRLCGRLAHAVAIGETGALDRVLVSAVLVLHDDKHGADRANALLGAVAPTDLRSRNMRLERLSDPALLKLTIQRLDRALQMKRAQPQRRRIAIARSAIVTALEASTSSSRTLSERWPSKSAARLPPRTTQKIIKLPHSSETSGKPQRTPRRRTE